MGGGASLGEAGLEVAPPSSEGPQRMLKGDPEGRSDTSTTWRTFLAQSCRSSVIPSTRAGRLGAGGGGGWFGNGDRCGQASLGPGAQEHVPLLSVAGTWVAIQLPTERSTSPGSTPQTLKLFSRGCFPLRPGGGGNQG